MNQDPLLLKCSSHQLTYNTITLICVTEFTKDYEMSLPHYLYFNNTDRQKCYNITIIDDDNCEVGFENDATDEIFYSILSTYALNVSIYHPMIAVSIDDDQEPECGR